MLDWQRLSGAPPTTTGLLARLAFPGRRRDLHIATDCLRRRHLLVELPAQEAPYAERISKGLSVSTIEMDVGGGALGRFIDIACLEVTGQDALDLVAKEIADALDSGAASPRRTVVKGVLAHWRRFWSGVPLGLSEEARIGLIGELWFLLRWLAPAVGGEMAIDAWRGPFKARTDFQALGISVEVKTTSSLGGRHVINGLEQLQTFPGEEFYLFSLCLREERSASDSLASLIGEVRSTLESKPEALDKFEDGLAASGVVPDHMPIYAEQKYRLRSATLFRVTDGFPRLVPESLVAKRLPAGVAGVHYEIEPGVASELRVADKPEAASGALGPFGHAGSAAVKGGRTG